MLDPRSLATQRSEIIRSCELRGIPLDIDALVESQKQVSVLQTELNEVNRRRKEHQSIGKQRLGASEREAHLAEGRAIKETVSRLEKKLADHRRKFEADLIKVPNFLHPSVPPGGEDDGKSIRQVGHIPNFDFKPKDHIRIGEDLDLFDFEGGAKVAGQKFYYYKNAAALLELALQRYALDILTAQEFTPYVTPDLARSEIVAGLGFNPRGQETQIYSVSDTNLCLIGTAEITLGGLYVDTILSEEDLPIKMAGISHCFRTEAGAAGKESKGLYRVHQFTKVEMFVITRPEDSNDLHEKLLSIEETIFQGLEIPYRVIEIAAGDLGAPAYRKFDLEAWMPGRESWGEITSTSNCTDFQARRLKIRFRRDGSKNTELVHMLNGTAISNARTILAILENHQQSDGTIKVPEKLVPYLGQKLID